MDALSGLSASGAMVLSLPRNLLPSPKYIILVGHQTDFFLAISLEYIRSIQLWT